MLEARKRGSESEVAGVVLGVPGDLISFKKFGKRSKNLGREEPVRVRQNNIKLGY